MKLIIAGTRDLKISEEDINYWVHHFNIVMDIEQIVSGNSGTVDLKGEKWSKDYLQKDPIRFIADWDHLKCGLAGPSRNKEMANYADALLLIWDGQSSGSLDMKIKMLSKLKPVYEVVLRAEKNPCFKEYNSGKSKNESRA